MFLYWKHVFSIFYDSSVMNHQLLISPGIYWTVSTEPFRTVSEIFSKSWSILLVNFGPWSPGYLIVYWSGCPSIWVNLVAVFSTDARLYFHRDFWTKPRNNLILEQKSIPWIGPTTTLVMWCCRDFGWSKSRQLWLCSWYTYMLHVWSGCIQLEF